MKEKIPHGGQIKSPFWRWAYGLRKKTDVIDQHTRLLPGKLACPEYVKSALRISLLLVSMFVGVSLQVFLLDVINGDGDFDDYQRLTRGIVLTFAVLPPVLLIHLVLDISSHLTMACKTELLKDSKVVGFVLEIMKVNRVIQKLIPVAEAMMAHAEAAGHQDPHKNDPAHQRYKPNADENTHHQAHKDITAVLVQVSATADRTDDSGHILLDRDMVAKAMKKLDLIPHTLLELKKDGNLSTCSWTGPTTTEWINKQLVEMGYSGGPESCVTLDDLKTHIYTIIHDIQSNHTNNKHAGLVDFIWKVIRKDNVGAEDEDEDEDEDEGGVKAEALQAVFAKYSVEISVGEIEDIIHSVDKDGDGMINKEEFHTLLKLAEISEDE